MNNTTMTEDAFLTARVTEQRPVNCWLASGIKLEGTILAFDTDAIFMRLHSAEDDTDVMMVFKLQVASIAPVPQRDSARLPDGLLTPRAGGARAKP
jgi:sRNA-binding regulator protein Hfq